MQNVETKFSSLYMHFLSNFKVEAFAFARVVQGGDECGGSKSGMAYYFQLTLRLCKLYRVEV